MFTAIYVRQSADRADSVSLETQEALCRADIPKSTEIRVYSDRGFSGKNTDRPALQAMMQAVERGEVAAVLVYKLDRISRNLADFTQLLRAFQAHHVEFSSHSERFETATPMGQAMQSLLMVFAQLERETISSRVRDSAFARAKLGFDTGGIPPVGFRKIPTQIGGKRTQMLEMDTHAQTVSEGFRRYALADGSLHTVADFWNAAGLRTGRGGEWAAESVRRVLRNPVYVQSESRVFAYLSEQGAEICGGEPFPVGHGIYLYADRRINHSKFTDLRGVYAISAPHLGIVPPELWLACQEKLTHSRAKRNSGVGTRFLYSGLLFCTFCGSAVTTVRGRSADYLVCGGKKRGICMGIGAVWRRSEAEELLENAVNRRLSLLSQIPLVSPLPSAQQHDLDAARLQIARLEHSLTDMADADIPAVAAAITKLTARCELLEQSLRRNTNSAQVHVFPSFSDSDFQTKKSVAQILIQCIAAEGDTLHVFWK